MISIIVVPYSLDLLYKIRKILKHSPSNIPRVFAFAKALYDLGANINLMSLIVYK